MDLNITTSDLNTLNSNYNKLNIYFTESKDDSIYATYGNYDPLTNEINIQVPNNADLDNLNSAVSHELIHREQNKKSNNNYSKWILSYGANLNEYIAKFNDRVDLGTSTQSEYNKILRMKETFKYSNTYELMAYAYQFTRVSTMFGVNTIHELINFIDTQTTVPVNNRLKKYIYKYWKIQETRVI